MELYFLEINCWYRTCRPFITNLFSIQLANFIKLTPGYQRFKEGKVTLTLDFKGTYGRHRDCFKNLEE